MGICMAASLCSVLLLPTQPIAQVVSLDPGKMPMSGTVDERFNSYNIEMVEVIGGKFWKPYADSAASAPKAREPARQEGFTPAGIEIRRV